MSTADRKRILDKIQKLLRLSTSSNPHEAASALRQAQKWMAEHGVSESDLAQAEVDSASYVSREPWKKKVPIYFTQITQLVSRAFGVRALYEPVLHGRDFRINVKYFGVNGRSEVAVWTHKVMWRAMWDSWTEYLKEHPELNNVRGARQGYWLGWLAAVRQTVIAFGGAKQEERPKVDGSGTELVLTAWGKELKKIEDAMTAYAGDVKEAESNKMKIKGDAVAAGATAARDFQLHRPINGAKQRQLSN